MSSSMEKSLTIKSSDGQVFELELAVAEESVTIKHMIEDGFTDAVIPIPNVTGATMAKVIEYSRKHAEANAKKLSAEDKATLEKWDKEFAQLDQGTLYHLLMAANYLNNKSLLELMMCQTVANMIKWKTSEEIRRTFNVVNDFTPKEEAEIRRENQWAFNQS